MICMANSWREGGRCVAGIVEDTGEWIRPVPFGGGPVPRRRTLVRNRELAPLDIVELRIRRLAPVTRFQKENCEVLDWNWKTVGRASIEGVLRHCCRSPTVLHNCGKVVEPSFLARLPEYQWTSLQLVRAENVTFTRHEYDPDRWQARFSVGRRGPDYRIKITDPTATERLNRGDAIASECLLTVSLTEPIAFPERGKPELCYKLVAGIVELARSRPTTDRTRQRGVSVRRPHPADDADLFF
jgi:hypothetical protein